MSFETIEKVTVKRDKFRQLRGDLGRAEFAEKLGIKPDMLSKIERGERWQTTLERFANYCERSGTEPNAFFEIVKKIS
jgi:transcriptional regulator with XRE-family HTH domain